MPIRINLLAEDLAAEEMRRKDPVKRAIWIGGFGVFLVLLWGLTIFLRTTIVRMDLAALETQWRTIEKTVKEVETQRLQTKEMEQRLSALEQFRTNRFLWANVLNAFQQTAVDNIQLTHVRSEQLYLLTEASKPASPAAPAAPATPAKPATATEKIVVYLDGRDFSARVAEQVPQFKEAIANSAYFQNTLQKTNTLRLTSLSAPQMDLARKTSYVVFGLQLNFQEKTRQLQ